MEERKAGIFNLSIENLFLDEYNPRLYGESAKESQGEIMKKIYEKEQLEELASSLAVNGYFTEEPIIVVPVNSADFSKIDEKNFDDFKYVVIEGNRRTTSIKLLLNPSYPFLDDDFPKINAAQKLALQNIPAIIYHNREDVDIYLSIRHITGNRKWDAFAKAKYIYEKVNSLDKNIGDLDKSIEKLSNQIGDHSNVVKKYYVYYKLFLQIESDVLQYSSRHIKDRFSLLEVALASGNTTISNYIGIQPFRKVDLNNDLVSIEKIDELQNVTQWIFGKDAQGKGSIINDSRQISSHLKPILGNPDAIDALKKYEDLEMAYELTNGEEQMVLGNLRKSAKYLNAILSKVTKYKDNEDFKGTLKEVEDAVSNIKKLMS